jgi:hypothetical protein
MHKLVRWPSPAMVIAVLALIVALSGTSLASDTVGHISALINGKRIKKGSIPGKALKKNTLTGTQINESKLGKVPKAASADTAANAANAANAATAANANALGGIGPANFQTFAERAIPSGTTVTGAFGISANNTGSGSTTTTITQGVSLPGVAPVALTDGNVNFGAGSGAGDFDAACSGSATNPTAPAGKVCLYETGTLGGSTSATGNALPVGGSRYGFEVQATQSAAEATGVWGVWAYTAP